MPHLVLAFPMPLEKRMRFADRHKLDVDLSPSQRDISAQIYIHEHIPEHRRNVASVQYKPGKWELAWAVATNKTEKDLNYALRLDEIKHYQKFLGLTDPPKWYYAREDPEFWYASDTPTCHSFLNTVPTEPFHILCEGSIFISLIRVPRYLQVLSSI